MSNIVLGKDSFYRRIKRLYANWKEPEFSHDDSLKKVDCILTAVGVDEETIYSKSNSLQTWLLRYALIDTIKVLCEKSIFFLTSKKIDFWKQIEKDGEEGIPSVKLLVQDKNDKDKANFEKAAGHNQELQHWCVYSIQLFIIGYKKLLQ
ncbi:FACT complex subunit spt16-like [Ochlerotatus camptorhynchus]|uniref:FACT complex subunit spt16-like n=1 Tax=Ochlerotatus camptorhynchus TaxID=644619 RepID=UPI0031E2EC8E